MTPFQKLIQFMEGKKTYATAGAIVAYAGLGYYLQFLSSQEATNYLFAAFTLIGGRSAMQKLIDSIVNYTPVIVHQHILQDTSVAVPVVSSVETLVPKTDVYLQPSETVTQQVL